MPCIIRVARVVNLGSFAVALLLAIVQPWQSAHLYVPIRMPDFLTVDNQYASWTIRFGTLGGVDGFDAGFTQTHPDQAAFLRKRKPFPVNWVVDWGFRIRRDKPFLLIYTPLYFPVFVLGIGPFLCAARVLIQRKKRLSSR
jgi:hypothetical protein